MESKMPKFLVLCLSLMCILSLTLTPKTTASPTPVISVVPARNAFTTDTTTVGDTFTVNISTSDWGAPGLFSYEFKLYYDTALLDVAEAGIPEGHFLTPTIAPTNIFIVKAGEIHEEEGYVVFAATLLAPEEGKTGSGVFGYITFQITKAPPPRVLNCTLELRDIILVDFEGHTLEEYEFDVEHGYYEFSAPKPPLPVMKIEPAYVTAKEIGDHVSINVTIQNVMEDWRIVGFEWKVRFNTTLLEGLEAVEGDYLASEAAQAAAETGEDYGAYFHAIWEEDYVLSFTLYYRYPWPPEIFPGHYKTGGTLATLTFNVTYKPTFADLVASCDLLLTDILLVDVEGNTVEYEPPVSGRYEIAVAAPPWLSLEPKEYTAEAMGEEFPLTVFINELSSDWRLVGVEFKIRFNKTMLSVVDITEAGFMRHFAELAGTETWFQYYVEEDPESGFGLVGILLLPLPNGTWPGPFPDTEDYAAPGDLATVTFKAIYQHEELDLTSNIYLDDIILANSAGKEIPYDRAKTAEEGICRYTIKRAIPPAPPPVENGIDLFTQYPEYWGGKGLETVSDAFPPQGVVKLNAFVVYHFDPVVGKPVSYELTAPSGAKYYSTAFTGDDGVATFEFSLPALELGLWTVKASVDLAGTVYGDTLWFLEGWLVETLSVEIPEPPYYYNDIPGVYKGESVELRSTLIRICWQDPREVVDMALKEAMDSDLLLHVMVSDELGQLAGGLTADLPQIGEITPFNYIKLREFVKTVGELWEQRGDIILENYPELVCEISFGITISPYAYSGLATVHVNLLTNSPGVAYAPEFEAYVWIKKRA